MSRDSSLFKNTLAQSASVLAGYVFSFVLAPIMIARLGLDQFGVWAVTGALATYAGLLDLGIGRSLSRFVAVFDAGGRDRAIRECVGLGLMSVTTVGALAAAAAAASAPILSEQIGVLSTAQMRLVALSSVAIWTLNGYSSVLSAVAIGKRRMVPPNVAGTIGISVNFAFSVAALAASTHLAVYAAANAAASLVAIVPSFFAMRYLWKAPYFGMPSRALAKEVLVFGVKNQVGWLADLVNFQTDKVVIALIVDVRAAAVYEIASRVVMGVRGAAILTLSAMIPTTAAQLVREGREVIGDVYRRYTLRSCSIAFPLFMFASVSAPFLLVAWLGKAPGDSALIVPLLTLAYVAHFTTGGGSTISIGAGRPGMVSANSLLIAVLNVALTVALAPWLGLWGVVLGTFLALLLGSIRFTQRFLKLFDLPWRDFFAGVLPPGALASLLAVPPALLALAVGTPAGRAGAVVLLAVAALAYIPAYWLVASRRRYLPERLRIRLPSRGQSVESTV
ncbi:MAG TPA: oligosaccharide flippase family protein [Gemmatimonadales bacterium]|nr:oligosaccharide flippase family protein [Gemmatimonadales bacterium]